MLGRTVDILYVEVLDGWWLVNQSISEMCGCPPRLLFPRTSYICYGCMTVRSYNISNLIWPHSDPTPLVRAWLLSGLYIPHVFPFIAQFGDKFSQDVLGRSSSNFQKRAWRWTIWPSFSDLSRDIVMATNSGGQICEPQTFLGRTDIVKWTERSQLRCKEMEWHWDCVEIWRASVQ